MTDASEATWFPSVVGAVALLMGLLSIGDLVFTPAAQSEQVVCGYMFTGTTAQVVTLLHVMLFLWIAWGSFLRQRFVAFVTAGYLLYLVASLWVWTLLFGAPRYPNAAAVLLLNLVSTLVLLTLCRVVFRRRAAFTR